MRKPTRFVIGQNWKNFLLFC